MRLKEGGPRVWFQDGRAVAVTRAESKRLMAIINRRGKKFADNRDFESCVLTEAPDIYRRVTRSQPKLENTDRSRRERAKKKPAVAQQG